MQAQYWINHAKIAILTTITMKRPIDHFRNFWWCRFSFYFWTLTVQLHKKVTLLVFCFYKPDFFEIKELVQNTDQWNCTFIYIWQ